MCNLRIHTSGHPRAENRREPQDSACFFDGIFPWRGSNLSLGRLRGRHPGLLPQSQLVHGE